MQSEKRLRALLSGATGFIGSRLAAALVQAGWEVHAMIRAESDIAKVAPYLSGAACFRSDSSYTSVKSIVEQSNPDVVFHLATHFLPEHTAGDISVLIQSNIEYGTHLMQSLEETNHAPLINTGTSWQYYHGEDYNPTCLYAATKQAFEDILKYYVSAKGQKATTLVLLDTYGPGDPRKKLFFHLKRAVAEKAMLPMSGGGQKLDLVYIDDVVSAYMVAAHHLLNDYEIVGGMAFRISSGHLWSLKEVVRMYEEALGLPIPVLWGARPYREREVMVPWTGGMSLPGWAPQVALPEGLMRMAREDAM